MTRLSLHEVLFDRVDTSFPDIVLNAEQSQQALHQAQENLRKQMEGLRQLDLHQETSRYMESLLDIPLDLVLVRGWLKLREVIRHIDKQKQTGSDETVVVYLSEHSIKSKHTPVMEVRMGSECIFSLQLDITLSLKLSGVGIVIKQAAVQEVISGTCKGTGVIAYRGEKLLEKEIAKLKLFGKLHIADQAMITTGEDETEHVLVEQAAPTVGGSEPTKGIGGAL